MSQEIIDRLNRRRKDVEHEAKVFGGALKAVIDTPTPGNIDVFLLAFDEYKEARDSLEDAEQAYLREFG